MDKCELCGDPVDFDGISGIYIKEIIDKEMVCGRVHTQCYEDTIHYQKLPMIATFIMADGTERKHHVSSEGVAWQTMKDFCQAWNHAQKFHPKKGWITNPMYYGVEPLKPEFLLRVEERR
jgi:hypothetical protein